MAAPLLRTVVLTFLALAVCAGAASAGTHVRALTPAAGNVIAHGLARSTSFRALVERLDRSDVVVYVRDDRALTRTLAARLVFMTAAGGMRYVMVRLSRRLSPSRQVAALGHELAHAVEIAERPGIVDEASLARDYASFGTTGASAHGPVRAFETRRAMAAADRVFAELIR